MSRSKSWNDLLGQQPCQPAQVLGVDGAAFDGHHLALAVSGVGDPAAIGQAAAHELALLVVGVAGNGGLWTCRDLFDVQYRVSKKSPPTDEYTGG